MFWNILNLLWFQLCLELPNIFEQFFYVFRLKEK